MFERIYKMCCCCIFMKRRGGILLAVGIAIAILIGILLVAGIYFYNFYVFKTVRICVSDATDTLMPCGVTQDCIDMGKEFGFEIDLSDAPDFIQDNFREIIDEIIYCDGTCFVKNVRGFDYETQGIEMLESCEGGEVEFVIEIRGKEGWEIWKWIREKGP